MTLIKKWGPGQELEMPPEENNCSFRETQQMIGFLVVWP